MRRTASQSAFTLIELLVVIGIISILVAISFPIFKTAILHADCVGCASRMHILGLAFMSYANDNDGQFPGRVTDPTAGNKWPVLLLPYVGSDTKAYVDPGDPIANAVPAANLVSNTANNSSFFFNGFSDLGFYTNPNMTVRLVNLTNMSNLILLGQKVNGSTQYYMDFVEGNENDVLNKTAYFGGSNYVFADGSARFLTLANYSDTMWLVNTSYVIPTVPGH